MSDPTSAPATPPPPSGGGLLSQVSLAALLSAGTGVVTAIAGAGWPGVVMLALLGAAIPFGVSKLIGVFNGWADERDADRAGDDAGSTAVDMANQGHAVNAGLDELEKSDPPTAGLEEKK